LRRDLLLGRKPALACWALYDREREEPVPKVSVLQWLLIEAGDELLAVGVARVRWR
jgi:hypothetical protein